MSSTTTTRGSICVYCGSSTGARGVYREAAAALGQAIAQAGWRLVYGGARVGLMGALADAGLAAGGEVHGVIPASLMAREVAHPGLTTLHRVETMHARKQAMSDAADAFVALPGGFGTLDEMFEMLTWYQLGLHDKPCGMLNTADYFAALLRCMAHMRAEGFVAPHHLERLIVAGEPEDLLRRLTR